MQVLYASLFTRMCVCISYQYANDEGSCEIRRTKGVSLSFCILHSKSPAYQLGNTQGQLDHKYYPNEPQISRGAST